ncbi:Inner centromere protein ARK-binding domain-containing protein [Madurella fahalii]|uniref:Inner centromere protein ARK-binding domain-containing protein n=1 Tax=Madurella fahalii TaxID=1157608 RepID=A0ABQ0G0B0_9PEZI
MERDGLEKAGAGTDSRIPQRASRFTSPLVINSASQRRSLFSRPRPKEDSARPTSSGGPTDTQTTSPNDTRIPRPASRRTFTLSDAYRLAEEEEAAQGSPSPAPRSWRSRRESSDKRSSKFWGTASTESQTRPGLNRTSLDSAPDSAADGLQSRQSDTSDSTFDEKLRQYALDQSNPEEPVRRGSGLFSRSKIGSKIVETGRELVRKTSRSSLDGSSPRASKTTGSSTWRRLSGRKRESSNASSAQESAGSEQADHNSPNELPQPGGTPPGFPSPNKSFAWQADADFTAGDLQISSSPPVRRSNSKIEDIRALEAEVREPLPESPRLRHRNTRIDEIRALEIETALKFRDEPEDPVEDRNDAQQVMTTGDDLPPRSRSVSRSRRRMDELRSRELGNLSGKALAPSQLDERRDNDAARTSRPPSPDMARKSGGEPLRASSPLGGRLQETESGGLLSLAQGQAASASQNTNAQPSSAEDPAQTKAMGVGENRDTSEKPRTSRSASQARDEPRDLLRRLAVAASSSPIPEPRVTAGSEALETRDRGMAEDTTQKRLSGGAKSDTRPTVGFAGLPRNSSIESGLAKRMSFVNSDSDPTERIEGEMKLFAPMENQSERGSLRAPSPEPEGDVPDKTPKTTKPDPLTQPTPRVTGAYVETPATVKIEKLKDDATVPVVENGDAKPQTTGLGRPAGESTSMDSKTSLRGRRDSIAARQPRHAQSTRRERSLSRSSSLSIRRRARSLPRDRAPLTNSVKPPTVKDDLLEIHRVNQIDDSTLEDIADLLGQQSSTNHIVPSRGKVEPENSDSDSGSDRLDMKRELDSYDRMIRSLQTGLLGIRTAKQGITRLEDKVSHAETKDHPHAAHGNNTTAESQSCPICHGSQPAVYPTSTFVHLPLPHLWSRQPGFRFTFLGLVLFLVSLWYVAESWMCFLYCKPQYCYPGTPCDWTLDDPVWGYAIPVKLDQWTTGGRGRELVRHHAPEVVDWLADLWDAAAGVDITTVDTSRYSWEQLRQHRRRLAKKGLDKRFVERPEDREIFSAWRAARLARETAQSAREMGFDLGEDESITGDERV